mgnify:CR=1 FL=1
MLKSEFDNLIETRKPTDAEYNMIETIYMYHPAIDDVHGKMQVAQLWDIAGVTVFEDMLPRAEASKVIDNKIRELKRKIKELEKMQSLSDYYQEVSWLKKENDEEIDI